MARKKNDTTEPVQWKMASLKARITFARDLLGTTPTDDDLRRKYVESLAPKDKTSVHTDVDYSVDDLLAKGTTAFYRHKGVPVIRDYQFKGFCKDACGVLRRVPGTKSYELTAYQKVIDGLVFCVDEHMQLNVPEGCAGASIMTRPLRTSGVGGERVALVSSECLPAGTWFDVEIKLLDARLMSPLLEWLDYGQLRGIGQWRNSGKGAFTWARL